MDLYSIQMKILLMRKKKINKNHKNFNFFFQKQKHTCKYYHQKAYDNIIHKVLLVNHLDLVYIDKIQDHMPYILNQYIPMRGIKMKEKNENKQQKKKILIPPYSKHILHYRLFYLLYSLMVDIVDLDQWIFRNGKKE